MVLIIAAVLGAVSLYVTNSAKLQSNIKLQDKSQKDIENAVAKINSLLLNPAHCNANFFGKPITGGTLLQLNKCDGTNNCRTGGTPTLYFDTNPATTTFKLAVDNPSNDNARISSASYVIEQPQTTTPYRPALLRLDVVFQRKLGQANGIDHTSKTSAFKFYTWVVTNNYNHSIPPPHALDPNPSGNILGCAKSSASTFPY